MSESTTAEFPPPVEERSIKLFDPEKPEDLHTPHILKADPDIGKKERFERIEEIKLFDTFMQYFEAREKEGIPPDTVFFLDKSGRPLALPFRKLYKDYCQGAKIPEVRFINLGRVSGQSQGIPFTGDPATAASAFRGIKEDGRFVVVDEYALTGKTIEDAVEFMKKAYPKAAEVSGFVAFPYAPSWYGDKDAIGVQEYTDQDFSKMALQKVNEELKTYMTKEDLEKADDKTRALYTEQYNSIHSNALHVKRREGVWETISVRTRLPFLEMLKKRKFLSDWQEITIRPDKSLRRELKSIINDVRQFHQKHTAKK